MMEEDEDNEIVCDAQDNETILYGIGCLVLLIILAALACVCLSTSCCSR